MSATIDQQFVEYIIKSLVSNPEDVSIERTIDEKGVLLELTVNPEDLGRVIGKRGAAAQALRTLLRALGTKNDARYNLKIVDNGDGPNRRDERDDRRDSTDQSESTINKVFEDKTAITETPSPVKPAVDTSANDPVTKTEEPTPVKEAPAKVSDERESDMLSNARKELADLDDLDI